jgi:tetratricopeptide (TPR) repeat protein
MSQEVQQWMIRDTANVIRGPYPQAELVNLIKKGQLKPKTEMARANSYWFSIEEKVELAKFFPELGLAPPEDLTRATATLTRADQDDHGVEITQFTQAPSRKELAQMSQESKDDPQPTPEMQWLDEDSALEFAELGSDPTLELATNPSLEVKPSPEPGALRGSSEVSKIKPSSSDAQTDRAKREEMLNRASVKADTLPSERKDYQGERPRPISNVLRTPDRKTTGPNVSNTVVLPVEEHDANANIISPEDEAAANRQQKAKLVKTTAVILGLGAVVTAGVLFAMGALDSKSNRQATGKAAPGRNAEKVFSSLKNSFLLLELRSAKEALAELELLPDIKGNPLLALAHAVVKREFLLDLDGALQSLQTAKGLASEPKVANSVDQLIGVYSMEREPEEALQLLSRLSEADPQNALIKLNAAIAAMKLGNNERALGYSTGALEAQPSDQVRSEALLVSAWARDQLTKGIDPGLESAYAKIMETGRNLEKARLGMAIVHLRKRQLSETEREMKAFIDLLPAIDGSNEVRNFRMAGTDDFYTFIRDQIREHNVRKATDGDRFRPDPYTMAADAILSGLQSRYGEAVKILETALSSLPGDPQLLKAMAYLRFREGRYAEAIEAVKDIPKDRQGFSVPLIIGKSQEKLGQLAQAEVTFSAITTSLPWPGLGSSLLGDVQLAQGKKAEARRSFDRALQISNYDLRAWRGIDKLGVLEEKSELLPDIFPF